MAELSRLHGLEADLERFRHSVLDYEVILRDRSEDACRAVEALRVARQDFDRAVSELEAFRDLLAHVEDHGQ